MAVAALGLGVLEVRVAEAVAAVEQVARGLVELRREVARGRRDQRQRAEVRRGAAPAGAGADEREATDPRRRGAGELLRHHAAERIADDVDPLVPELVEEADQEPGDDGQRERDRARARAAGAGRVEDDRARGLRQPVLGRAPHVGVAAEAVDQQQRMSVALLAEVQPQAADGHVPVAGGKRFVGLPGVCRSGAHHSHHARSTGYQAPVPVLPNGRLVDIVAASPLDRTASHAERTPCPRLFHREGSRPGDRGLDQAARDPRSRAGRGAHRSLRRLRGRRGPHALGDVRQPRRRRDPADGARSDSPLGRRLAKHGEGVHHICFTTDNPEETSQRLAEAGMRTTGEVSTDPTMPWQRWTWISPTARTGRWSRSRVRTRRSTASGSPRLRPIVCES